MKKELLLVVLLIFVIGCHSVDVEEPDEEELRGQRGDGKVKPVHFPAEAAKRQTGNAGKQCRQGHRKQPRHTIAGHQDRMGIGPDSDESRVAEADLSREAGKDHQAKAGDSVDVDEAEFVQIHQAPLLDAASDRAGRLVASIASDNSIAVWDAMTGNILRLHHSQTPVWGVLLAGDGVAITRDDDYRIRVWGPAGSRTLGSHEASIWTFALSPDERTVASIDDAGTVRLWDTEHGEQAFWSPSSASLRALAFSRTGEQLAVATIFGELFRYRLPQASGGGAPPSAVSAATSPSRRDREDEER